MKSIIILFLTAIISNAATTTLPTVIDTDLTLSDTVFLSNASVTNNATLTILPGTVMLGDDSSANSITVEHGTISAIGTSTDSVYFYSVEVINVVSDSAVSQFQFIDAEANCKFAIKHGGSIDIRHSKNVNFWLEEGGKATISDVSILNAMHLYSFFTHFSLTIKNSHIRRIVSEGGQYSISLTNCTFDGEELLNSSDDLLWGGGLLMPMSATLLIDSCTFKNFNADIGGAIHASGDVTIKNSSFYNNFTTINGGALSMHMGSILLEDCHFYDNRASQDGGAINFFSDVKATINRCKFYNNSSKVGAAISGDGNYDLNTISIKNSEFIGNKDGTVIHIFDNYDPTLELINNTIADNDSGIRLHEDVYSKITNSILWNNGESFTNGTPYVSNNNYIEEEQSASPLFVNPVSHDYSLSNSSPCINSGTSDTSGLAIGGIDLAGNPRIVSNRIDIGAYENQEPVSTTIPYKKMNNQMSVSIERSKLYLKGLSNGKYTLSIYTLSGRLVSESGIEIQNSIVEVIPLHKEIAAGNYILKIKNNTVSENDYRLLMRIY